jgi:hypothetical protein
MDWVAHDRGKVDGHDQVWNRIFHIINADCIMYFRRFELQTTCRQMSASGSPPWKCNPCSNAPAMSSNIGEIKFIRKLEGKT